MSSKDIYEARRYRAARYAAGRWRGTGGVPVTVDDPITQNRTFSPYTGMRYGSFVKLVAEGRHFMHGTLTVYLSLRGNIKIEPSLSGQIDCRSYSRGIVKLEPSLDGQIHLERRTTGGIEVNP